MIGLVLFCLGFVGLGFFELLWSGSVWLGVVCFGLLDLLCFGTEIWFGLVLVTLVWCSLAIFSLFYSG